jgi:octaprenyl-diphosphate synthase
MGQLPASGAQARDDIAACLREVRCWIGDDMARIAAELAVVQRDTPAIHRSARHLLHLGGKQLRPMCVVLATRLGARFGAKALDIAVAVELIHNATLLHDDVIDVGDRRRGAPAARVLHGNAASVLSGDWLLIQALRRVRRASCTEVLERTLTTVEGMIEAEMLQLANRGLLNTEPADYFRVIEGKTASLFRLALFCGARVAGLTDDQCEAVEAYGAHIGVAFQLVDDLLDFAGDATMTGKALFNDLREGRMTYPFLVALERDPSLRPAVEGILSQPDDRPVAEPVRTRVLNALLSTGGARDCLSLAQKRVAEAVACLGAVPAGRGRAALVTLAEAILYRQR